MATSATSCQLVANLIAKHEQVGNPVLETIVRLVECGLYCLKTALRVLLQPLYPCLMSRLHACIMSLAFYLTSFALNTTLDFAVVAAPTTHTQYVTLGNVFFRSVFVLRRNAV